MPVTICDVGPRDGLQNEQAVLEPPLRVELVERLAAAGADVVEAVSFVDPRLVPQMAGAEEVVAGLFPREGPGAIAGLVLNEKGFERLAATPLGEGGEVHFNLAATDSFSRRNANASVEEALDAGRQVLARARERGLRTSVSIGVAFGCPFEGKVDPGRVVELVGAMTEAGADELVLADTIGVAVPRQVRHLVAETRRVASSTGVHLHNTRNTGFANAYAALEAGATAFEASVGGLGGCPFAPRATGNVATEDLVYLLHGEGVETGVDLDALVAVSRWLEGVLGRQLPGQVYRAGSFEPLAG